MPSKQIPNSSCNFWQEWDKKEVWRWRVKKEREKLTKLLN